MRQFDSAQAAYRAARSGVEARHLVWVTARNRTTGEPETMGLWTGDDVREITVAGSPRTYFGAGAVIEIEPIRAAVGLDVRMQQVTLSPLTAEVEQLIRGYDTRLAPVEIHEAVFDPASGALVGQPFRIFKGWMNELQLPTPAEGQQTAATATLASAARALTRTVPAFRSDAAMRLRDPADRFREYTDIAGEIGVWWGEKKVEPKPAAAPTTTPRVNNDSGWGKDSSSR